MDRLAATQLRSMYGSLELVPGVAQEIVRHRSIDGARAMVAACWFDYVFLDADAPAIALASKVTVLLAIDQSVVQNFSGGAPGVFNGPSPQILPTCGIRRQITAGEISIVVALSGDAPASSVVRVRASVSLAHENAEGWLVGGGNVSSATAYTYALPRFATHFRTYDWSGVATLQFVDLTNAAGPLPLANASAHSEWTPLPVGAAAVIVNQPVTGGIGCSIQFGRD